jgi:hypothetical protein
MAKEEIAWMLYRINKMEDLVYIKLAVSGCYQIPYKSKSKRKRDKEDDLFVLSYIISAITTHLFRFKIK